jgi:hypothetical protein
MSDHRTREDKEDDFLQLFNSIWARLREAKGGIFVLDQSNHVVDNVTAHIMDKALKEAIKDYLESYPRDDIVLL